jgi:hypothetical protein
VEECRCGSPSKIAAPCPAQPREDHRTHTTGPATVDCRNDLQQHDLSPPCGAALRSEPTRQPSTSSRCRSIPANGERTKGDSLRDSRTTIYPRARGANFVPYSSLGRGFDLSPRTGSELSWTTPKPRRSRSIPAHGEPTAVEVQARPGRYCFVIFLSECGLRIPRASPSTMVTGCVAPKPVTLNPCAAAELDRTNDRVASARGGFSVDECDEGVMNPSTHVAGQKSVGTGCQLPAQCGG